MSSEAIVCDLGGTFLRFAVANEAGSLEAIETLHTANYVSENVDTTWEKIIHAIRQYAWHVCGKVSSDSPLVLAIPGPVDKHRRILNAPAIGSIKGKSLDICARLRDCLNRPVCALNDVSAAAWYYGGKVDADRLLILSVGSGIGSKISDRTRRWPVVDEVPYAGELGHVVVDTSKTALRCGCGGRGHLEMIASGKGIQRNARERATQDPIAFNPSACAKRFRGAPACLTNEDHIVPAVHLDDKWATHVVRECTRPLARVLTIVATTTGVERVVVIGGFALSLGERYMTILREQVREYSDYGPTVSSLPSSLLLGFERDASLRGAAIFATRAQESPAMTDGNRD